MTYFSKRWSFLFLDTCLTSRRLNESYYSNRSRDFFASGFPGLFASLRNQCFRVLRDATQLRFNFHNSHCIFLSSLSLLLWDLYFSWLFVWLFIHLMMQEQTLISRFASRFNFVELTLGRMSIFTRRSRASTLQIISARLSKSGTMVTFASDTSFPRHTSTSCHWWLGRCGGIWIRFLLRTIVTLMPETALVSFRTLVFFFPLVAYTLSSFNAT